MANTHSIDLELSSSQYLSIADGSQTGLDITGDISFEAWVKVEQLPSTAGSAFNLIAKDDVSSSRAYSLFIDSDDKLKVYYFQNNSTFTSIFSDAAIVVSGDVGSWVHIATTVDVSAQTAVMYKNSSSVGSTPQTTNATSIQNSTAVFTIGANGSPSNYFDGLIDEVRVWDDIRTSQEISDNYKQEISGGSANLQGYWQFNNDLLDQTTNNNDLTNNGSATFSTDIPTWTVAYSLVMAVGAFTLTGIAAIFNYGKTLVASAGSFVLTGVAATLTSARTLAMAVGSFTLTGIAAVLTTGRGFIASAGSFILTGIDAILSTTAWSNDTKPTSSWTEDSKPTSNWTNDTK